MSNSAHNTKSTDLVQKGDDDTKGETTRPRAPSQPKRVSFADEVEILNQNEAVIQPDGVPSSSRDPNGKSEVGLAIDAPEKKKSIKASRKPKNTGTGFEEYYCDAPLMLQEAKQERTQLYHPSRSFEDRIEECIQRFRLHRRLDNDRTLLLNRFLGLGGIDTTVRQFQGNRNVDKEELEDTDAAALREMTANDRIERSGGDSRWYGTDPENWVVDFTGVAKGYLSETLPRAAGGDLGLILQGADVVLNFLRYVSMHDVCPECSEDLRSAQQVCDIGKVESRELAALWERVPGDFNTACALVFGGGPRKETIFRSSQIVFAATVAVWGNELAQKSQTVVRRYEDTFEVMEMMEEDRPVRIGEKKNEKIERTQIGETHEGICFPDATIRNAYARIKFRENERPRPCGLVRLAPVPIIDGWCRPGSEQLERECDEGKTSEPDRSKAENFFFEEGVLQCLRVGTKLTLTVYELDTSFKFVKEVRAVHPTFYTFLPQELMMHWKEPLVNERPPSSADDVEAEGELARNERE